jgi:hypothetical protein
MPLSAMASACSTYVSQNYGANHPDRVRRGMRDIYLYSVVVAAAAVLLMAAGAEWMVKLVSGSSEPVVLENGARYLVWNAPFYAVLGMLLSTRYVLWFILMAPCLLETKFSKRSSTLDILLPASAFEKFLHIWIKYLLLLPLFCSLLIACLKGMLSLSGSEFLQYFATHITMFRIHNTQILTYVILHASAFIGYFAFSRQVLLKSFTIFVGSIAVCIGIVTFVASLMPEARADGYWIDNIATWPNTNYPLSAGTQAIVTFCNYAAPISVLLGSWASSYFLLKEKQL